MLFQDDPIRDTTELKTPPTEEVEALRQEEKHVDVAVKEAPATQVINEAFCIDAYIRVRMSL